MYFEFIPTQPIGQKPGCLFYLLKEYSLYNEPWRGGGYTLLLAGQHSGLDVNEQTGEIMQVSGYAPMSSWIRKELKFPVAEVGKVIIRDHDLLTGVGEDYGDNWITYYDPASSCICIEDTHPPVACINVQITPDVVLSLHKGTLFAVWARILFA